jgi:hypothetical protein
MKGDAMVLDIYARAEGNGHGVLGPEAIAIPNGRGLRGDGR